MNPATAISLCTLRLSCTNGGASGTGTGFLYMFRVPVQQEGQEQTFDVPMIITNKHVVQNMTRLETPITLRPREAAAMTDAAVGADDVHLGYLVENLQETISFHPDPQIDLCAIPLLPFLVQIPPNLMLRHTLVTRDWRLSNEELSYTRPIEPVVMIGYPTGLWNEVDNRPIARRGLTASHPTQRWNGERKFLIDAACFPGSSGSPVFLFEDGMYRSGADGYTPGTRAKLIGVLFAGPLFTQQGRFEQRVIPTAVGTVPIVDAMMNLGYVVHADTLDDLIPVISARVEAELRASRAQNAV
ncbi:S1 family peptidase [Paraburkholderia unamae]|uniref:Trypsin-like peptidase n=1 Tax=Paraburkholderia unamae TaxID=219649 RepID=A0ABX5KPF2_9BURK|nr:serine protease [Paraburkholderia unamae]PVX84363.1 trypsin-like peptidase [Paraburkholderia unamae]